MCASEDKLVVLVACKLQDVGDVVPRVAVEGLLQPQLVEVVANEANGHTKHESAVEGAKRPLRRPVKTALRGASPCSGGIFSNFAVF